MWSSPPDRREVSLVLFGLTIFILSYNLDNSFRLLGLDPVATQGSVFSHIGLGGSSALDADGRRAPAWRDRKEKDIVGDWRWDKGQVAGNGEERQRAKGSDRYGAQWIDRQDAGGFPVDVYGETTVDKAVTWWGPMPPSTTLVKHVPGYSILDNVYLFNHSAYLVTDSPASFPDVSTIASWTANSHDPLQVTSWHIISTEDACKTMGDHGGRIHGVTWLSTDTVKHNTTMLSLWRTYSTLDPTIDSAGLSMLPSPQRLIFPHVPAFSDPKPPVEDLRARVRSQNGINPNTLKAAMPLMGILYKEDWEDFMLMELPFVLQRVVVADRGAAGRVTPNDAPAFSPPFEELKTSQWWWEPIRSTLATYLGVRESAKPVITYLSTQEEGPRLKPEDHETLVKALKTMGKDYGYEVKVISERSSWQERMTAVARSKVVLGTYGQHLLDASFMAQAASPTLMEFFPEGVFTRDQEVPIRALGTRYIAWWNNQKFSGTTLPRIVQPSGSAGYVSIYAPAVVLAIREELGRRTT